MLTKTLNILLIALTTLLLNTSCMDEPPVYENTYRGNFEALWKIIDTRYCYLDYKKINWDSIHSVYSVRIDTTRSNTSLFNTLGEMLGELKDGHVNLYSDFDISRYTKWYSDYLANFDNQLVYKARYLGHNFKIAGGFRYKLISNGDIGYILYNSFSNGFSDTNIYYIFKEFEHCKGIIIDVRNNGGGELTYASKLASYFIKSNKITGYISHKNGSGHSDFSTPTAITTNVHKTIQWNAPLAILTNRLSYSATNDFINTMKGTSGVTIIGDYSGGGGGIPLSSELPNGWLVRFSASPVFNIKMQHIEWGIEPDIKIDLDSTDIEMGYDTIIEKAISHIQKMP